MVTRLNAAVPRPAPRGGGWARALAWGYLAALLVYLYLPNLLVAIMAFHPQRHAGFPIRSLTLRWWAELFHNATVWTAVQNSLVVAAATTALTVVLGLLSAYALVRYRFRLKGALTGMLLAAMVVPYLVVGIALLSFWALLGVERGLHTVILAHVALALPYTTLVLAARLQGFDVSLEEAGMVLGASRATVFRRVTLPLLMPGVLAGAALAFSTSFDEFNVAYFVIGARHNTLPIYVYSSLRFGISPELNAISTLILLASVLLASLALRRN
jgi:spermidine/putrescine transport system permease protein